MTLAETIKRRLVSEFKANGYNVSHTAKALGISRRAFYRYAHKYRILLEGDGKVLAPGTNKQKDRARTLVHRAIERGELRVLPCEICHTTEDVQAHHDDYSKPMYIRWLCLEHHSAAHNPNRTFSKRTSHAFE